MEEVALPGVSIPGLQWRDRNNDTPLLLIEGTLWQLSALTPSTLASRVSLRSRRFCFLGRFQTSDGHHGEHGEETIGFALAIASDCRWLGDSDAGRDDSPLPPKETPIGVRCLRVHIDRQPWSRQRSLMALLAHATATSVRWLTRMDSLPVLDTLYLMSPSNAAMIDHCREQVYCAPSCLGLMSATIFAAPFLFGRRLPSTSVHWVPAKAFRVHAAPGLDDDDEDMDDDKEDEGYRGGGMEVAVNGFTDEDGVSCRVDGVAVRVLMSSSWCPWIASDLHDCGLTLDVMLRLRVAHGDRVLLSHGPRQWPLKVHAINVKSGGAHSKCVLLSPRLAHNLHVLHGDVAVSIQRLSRPILPREDVASSVQVTWDGSYATSGSKLSEIRSTLCALPSLCAGDLVQCRFGDSEVEVRVVSWECQRLGRVRDHRVPFRIDARSTSFGRVQDHRWPSQLPHRLLQPYCVSIHSAILADLVACLTCSRTPSGTRSILLEGPSGSGKSLLVDRMCDWLAIELKTIHCSQLMLDLCKQSSAASLQSIRSKIRSVVEVSEGNNMVLFLRDVHTLKPTNEHVDEESDQLQDRIIESLLQSLVEDYPHVVLMASTSRPCALSTAVRTCFHRHFTVSSLGSADRRNMIHWLQDQRGYLASDLDVDRLAHQMPAVTPRQLIWFFEKLYRDQVVSMMTEGPHDIQASLLSRQDSAVEMSCPAMPTYCKCVLSHDVLQQSQKSLHTPAGDGSSRFTLSGIPDVSWSDVGGLEHAKREIRETIELPLMHPHLFSSNCGRTLFSLKPRSGILLYGPPGTGKTLLAKAIASSLSCSFLSVKGPEIMNMYVGESERNIREIFSIARANTPCVIFFDELDSIATRKENSASNGSSGGVMDRIVSQFLAELDDMQSSKSQTGSAKDEKCFLFVVGATNRPDLLDPAFLRPGRFDRLVYLELPSSVAEIESLMKAVLRSLPIEPNVDWSGVLECLPQDRWTGADFKAWSMNASMMAMGRVIRQIEDIMKQIAEASLIPDEAQRADALDALVDCGYLREDWRMHSSTLGQITPDVYLKRLCPDPVSFQEFRITAQDFIVAARELQPSVSEEELKRYQAIQRSISRS